MNEQELQKLVELLSIKYFGRKFKHQVKINRRMTTTGGRYHLNDHHLEINRHFLAPQYKHELVGIIKHELVHYHLHLAKLGYRHSDWEFKTLLKQVGGLRYAPDIGLRRHQPVSYLYQCEFCKQKYARVRPINIAKYGCSKCRGHLKLIKMRSKK
ncbi:SprT-like protein [Lactobacillus bombicola]|uniref:SprT-like protein n=1 Tax=Lactobacillus bombicola TaxID=1505723 RepID=A0A1I1T5B9_9LACO|nr:SprT family protein [Lactobacillus bombicola]MCO6527840.1 SprT family protein [Lactobacillus sp.]SFD51443.1 SprT-like protein [Lactobacillus bombicola]